MPKKKLIKYQQFKDSPNSISYEDVDYRDKLNDLMSNDDIILEACAGSCEHSIALAKLFPKCTIVANDIKGDRLANGINKANELNISNIFYVRGILGNFLEELAENSLSSIWVTYPDPRNKDRDEKRRVISDRYMNEYRRVLKEGGEINIVTDSEKFYKYSISQSEKHQLKYLVKGNILKDVESIYSKKNISGSNKRFFLKITI